MPRTDRRRPARSEPRWNPWWLALPALGLAAYAAFAATLSLLGDDGSRAPSATSHDAVAPRPAALPEPAPAADRVAESAAVPAPGATAADDAVGASPAATGAVPAASATPAAQRVAADAARKVKPKRAPHEHLTEQDRRALDALVEQAGKNAR